MRPEKERREANMAGSTKRRHGGKRAAGKCERLNETTAVARLALVVWELIWALVHEHFIGGGSGRIP
jgi:hypothetical protein